MDIAVALAASLGYAIGLVFICARYREIKLPLAVGGAMRLVMCWVIGLRLAEIPGTTADARTFERVAREWAEMPWLDLMASFDPSRSYVISWVGAVIYKVSGPSPTLLNVVNAAVSVWLIVLAYKLGTRLFGSDRGRAAAWIVALFPFAVIYGSVFRREVFGSLFFMLGLLRSMDWARIHSPVSLMIALVLFGVAGIFHSGYLFGLIGLLGFAVGSTAFAVLRRRSIRSWNQIISGAMAASILMVALVGVIASGTALNNIGEVGSLSAAEAIEYRVAGRVSEGGSSYPDILRGVDPFSNPWVIPGRSVYFVLSPFPWDIRAPGHVVGFAATIYFFLILRSIIASRQLIFSNREAAVVLVITVSAVLVFAISIDNIGTSIRHRTKFIYPLAALCALPLFRRYRFTFNRLGRGARAPH